MRTTRSTNAARDVLSILIGIVLAGGLSLYLNQQDHDLEQLVQGMQQEYITGQKPVVSIATIPQLKDQTRRTPAEVIDFLIRAIEETNQEVYVLDVIFADDVPEHLLDELWLSIGQQCHSGKKFALATEGGAKSAFEEREPPSDVFCWKWGKILKPKGEAFAISSTAGNTIWEVAGDLFPLSNVEIEKGTHVRLLDVGSIPITTRIHEIDRLGKITVLTNIERFANGAVNDSFSLEGQINVGSNLVASLIHTIITGHPKPYRLMEPWQRMSLEIVLSALALVVAMFRSISRISLSISTIMVWLVFLLAFNVYFFVLPVLIVIFVEPAISRMLESMDKLSGLTSAIVTLFGMTILLSTLLFEASMVIERRESPNNQILTAAVIGESYPIPVTNLSESEHELLWTRILDAATYAHQIFDENLSLDHHLLVDCIIPYDSGGDSVRKDE